MYQIEMSGIRSIVSGATSKSLVLIDEICRGTETAKGTCIAGSVVETLDAIGCLGVVSTHLHGIFDLPLNTKNIAFKAMGSESVDGQTIPTWKLTDGICKESLAFETAQREGIPESMIRRAKELYFSAYAKDTSVKGYTPSINIIASETKDNHFGKAADQQLYVGKRDIPSKTESWNPMEILWKDVENAVSTICSKNGVELYKKKNAFELPFLNCVLIGAKEQPPPSTIGASSVYIMFRPDKKLYVGQVLI